MPTFLERISGTHKVAVEPAPASLLQTGAMVEVRDLRKRFRTGSASLEIFRALNLTVARGEMLAITGESGSGKSTLLQLLAAMDTASAGYVVVDGIDVRGLDAEGQAELRNQTVGFVWQAHYLLPEFTAAENVAMPLLARGVPVVKARTEALRLLEQVGLADRGEHRSGELSGGEQQRVALARALVTEPKLLLADEPTGSLDDRTAEIVFELLQRLHTEHALTTVMVTHHRGFAARCERALELRGGGLQPLSSN